MTIRLGVAVIGLGRAGTARARALEGHKRARLVAAVRGRDARELSRVLARRDVDAAIICTPNLLHSEQARAVLAAGKHTAVEFPLAPDAAEARSLFELARRRQSVLHVEHIELLSGSHIAQRQRARALGRPGGGTLSFQGGVEGWIGDAALAGSPALRAVARIHELVDIFGEAEVTRATLAMCVDGYTLEVAFGFFRGGSVNLVERRALGLTRRKRWDVSCERGPLDDPRVTPGAHLFRADLDCFLDRIDTGSESYVTEQRIEHVLNLVTTIDTLTSGGG